MVKSDKGNNFEKGWNYIKVYLIIRNNAIDLIFLAFQVGRQETEACVKLNLTGFPMSKWILLAKKRIHIKVYPFLEELSFLNF